MRRIVIGLIAAASVATLLLAGAAGAAGRANELAAVRAATAKFHDFDVASRAGYGEFYVCTDEDGLGAMGQHYVNGGLLDAVADPRRPEALMYEPLRGGGSRLVAVEWVIFQGDWLAAGHEANDHPELFGRDFTFMPEGNRYGIPPFYQLHAWVWKPNPAGVFKDFNPQASCLGNGD